MYNMIINYINKLKKEDILYYCEKNNIKISSSELDTLFYYIKNRFDDFLNSPYKIINELKEKLSNDNYLILINLYSKYMPIINKISSI